MRLASGTLDEERVDPRGFDSDAVSDCKSMRDGWGGGGGEGFRSLSELSLSFSARIFCQSSCSLAMRSSRLTMRSFFSRSGFPLWKRGLRYTMISREGKDSSFTLRKPHRCSFRRKLSNFVPPKYFLMTDSCKRKGNIQKVSPCGPHQITSL